MKKALSLGEMTDIVVRELGSIEEICSKLKVDRATLRRNINKDARPKTKTASSERFRERFIYTFGYLFAEREVEITEDEFVQDAITRFIRIETILDVQMDLIAELLAARNGTSLEVEKARIAQRVKAASVQHLKEWRPLSS